MKKLLLIIGPLTVILFTANSSLANPSQVNRVTLAESTKVSQQRNATSLPVVVNPKFDDYVRTHRYVRFSYKNDSHARLLGLADRFMSHYELKKAITQILMDNR